MVKAWSAWSVWFFFAISCVWRAVGQDEHLDDSQKSKNEENVWKMSAKWSKDDVARKTIRASENDQCDWKINPLSIVKGELCGSHYKVLGLNRHHTNIDKSLIKKSYRQRSLAIHPDKNPSSDAETAFQVVQNAYKCLSDDSCRAVFDASLLAAESEIRKHRKLAMINCLARLRVAGRRGVYALHYVALQFQYFASQTWNYADTINCELYGKHIPIGRGIVMLVSMFSRTGRLLFVIHALSVLMLKLEQHLSFREEKN